MMMHHARLTRISFLVLFLSQACLVAGDLTIPEKKQTSLGLYVSASKAYEMWRKRPEAISIVDVRSPEEYAYIGHPEMAINIPYEFTTYQRDAKKKSYLRSVNPAFVSEMKKRFRPGDTLIIMCRSGKRSAKAVNALAKEGFKNLYSVYDGFDGDKAKDPDNCFRGQRMKNGWRNCKLPWTYDCDKDLMYLRKAPAPLAERPGK